MKALWQGACTMLLGFQDLKNNKFLGDCFNFGPY